MHSTGGEPEEPLLRAGYRAATTAELRGARLSKRLIAIIDQRILFPHVGKVELARSALTFGGWRTLQPTDVASVSHRFVPEYSRLAAGGARGGFPSLGVVKGAGAPLVLDLRTGERIVLLVDYKVVSGIATNRSWLSAITEFAAE